MVDLESMSVPSYSADGPAFVRSLAILRGYVQEESWTWGRNRPPCSDHSPISPSQGELLSPHRQSRPSLMTVRYKKLACVPLIYRTDCS